MGFRQTEELWCNKRNPVSFLRKIWSRQSKFSQSSKKIRCPQPVGLKTLIHSEETPFIFHSSSKISHFRPTSSPESSSTFLSLFRSLSTHSSSFSSWSSGLDDLLGTESGVYMSSDHGKMMDYFQMPNVTKRSNNGKRNNKASTTKPKEYPPPIHSIVRTGDLAGHIPWILTRHHDNGRLTITQERIQHHEYLETRRENGRLILNLVTLDDTIMCHTVSEEEDHQPELFEEEEIEVMTEFDLFMEENDEKTTSVEVNELVVTHGVSLSVPKFCRAREIFVDPRQCFTYCDRVLMRSLDESGGALCDGGVELAMSSPSSSLEFWVPRPTAALVA